MQLVLLLVRTVAVCCPAAVVLRKIHSTAVCSLPMLQIEMKRPLSREKSSMFFELRARKPDSDTPKSLAITSMLSPDVALYK
jgi:hypothetical protein